MTKMDAALKAYFAVVALSSLSPVSAAEDSQELAESGNSTTNLGNPLQNRLTGWSKVPARIMEKAADWAISGIMSAENYVDGLCENTLSFIECGSFRRENGEMGIGMGVVMDPLFPGDYSDNKFQPSLRTGVEIQYCPEPRFSFTGFDVKPARFVTVEIEGTDFTLRQILAVAGKKLGEWKPNFNKLRDFKPPSISNDFKLDKSMTMFKFAYPENVGQFEVNLQIDMERMNNVGRDHISTNVSVDLCYQFNSSITDMIKNYIDTYEKTVAELPEDTQSVISKHMDKLTKLIDGTDGKDVGEVCGQDIRETLTAAVEFVKAFAETLQTIDVDGIKKAATGVGAVVSELKSGDDSDDNRRRAISDLISNAAKNVADVAIDGAQAINGKVVGAIQENEKYQSLKGGANMAISFIDTFAPPWTILSVNIPLPDVCDGLEEAFERNKEALLEDPTQATDETSARSGKVSSDAGAIMGPAMYAGFAVANIAMIAVN